MPSNATAKTKSAPKRDRGLLLACVGVVFAVVLTVLFVWWRMPHPATHAMQVGNKAYRLELATTRTQWAQGLSKRLSLPLNSGMLYVYPDAQPRRCLWMQDMGIPLDMIWLGADKKVVHIEHDVPPDSFPKQYCPDQPAQYAIELYAGQSQAADVKVGQQLHF